MEYIKSGSCILYVILVHLLALSRSTTYTGDVYRTVNENEARIGWVFSHPSNDYPIDRIKRSLQTPPDQNLFPNGMSKQCKSNLNRLCNTADKNDVLQLLECIQSFKQSDVSHIEQECQKEIFKFIQNITADEPMKLLAEKACGKELEQLDCSVGDNKQGAYFSCLIGKREEAKNPQCISHIMRLERIAFNDFRIITPFLSDCEPDIHKFSCSRTQPYRDITQGQILACLQENLHNLRDSCKKHILHLSEIQADSIDLDRQLYLSCTVEQMRFCSDIRPGSGQVYKCLIQHKNDRSMSGECQKQLERKEKLISSDYKISKGFVKSCRDDIKNYHCRRQISNDKNVRLAQILLCLESAVKNGSKIDENCQNEMFDHRQMLMNDYRLSPEMVDSCAEDIKKFCDTMEYDGKTIHCLMEHSRPRKRDSRIMPKCRRALEDLIKEADAGEDWRIDPILRESCQSVVDQACRDIRGGDARVITCLMDHLRSDKMTPVCETALMQIQYFIARDYKLDPQLYKSCKNDAIRYCHARNVWYNDGRQMDPERGPLVLPCLHRHAFHPEKNVTLKQECVEEIRRVMRQRAINVDLLPEIEEVCLSDLATYCFHKTVKGEEILCLQDRLDSLKLECKTAVANFTEEQAKQVELNPIISAACQQVIKRHCEDILKYGKDEGDVMECLIKHKNDVDTFSDGKCKSAVEHFQLISLKNYHFTYKFKEACKFHVKRWCPKSKTKADVIECLSTIVQEDTMKNAQHRIPKDCRQQLRAQLYQQREDIRFDPILQSACKSDILKLCSQVEKGNSQVHECLASHKSELSDTCHKQVFKIRRQEFQDSSSDFVLMNSCRAMIRQFCDDVPYTEILECLKKNKNEVYNEKCKKIIITRMIEQNTDYRFNTQLQNSCNKDIAAHCRGVIEKGPVDKELEGKVIKCLQIKFREAKLTQRCELQMTVILKEAALNYHLNPLLSTMCANEITTLCHAEETDSTAVENTPGAIEECLKAEFTSGNKDMKEECRMEIANLIEQAKADIHVDPLLHKACAVDINKFCSDVPQGAGRHVKCLQNVLEDNKKSLEPECHKKLSTRIEMFKNAAKLIEPNSLEELYISVNHSPARRYFMLVAFTMIGLIFIIGMFCGRVTRRTMLMKNK